jgi:hypothetical protein
MCGLHYALVGRKDERTVLYSGLRIWVKTNDGNEWYGFCFCVNLRKGVRRFGGAIVSGHAGLCSNFSV